MRRLIGLSVLTLAVTAFVPATAAAAGPHGLLGRWPLPSHSQHAVCAKAGHAKANCDAHVVTNKGGATPLASTSYTYGYQPTELQAAYGLPTSTGLPGTGPTVAIVDAYDNPNVAADLAAFRSQFGLGACGAGCFTKVNQTGGTSYPAGDTGWGAEIDLDVEMVATACPACKILLVEATSNAFTNLMAAEDYATGHASYVSNSFGGSEFSSETSYDSHFNHPGVGITVSSGDDGYGVEYPAASPYVTAVGGTSLTNTAGAWSETAWSGAGSGCSAYEAKPTWQIGGGCAKRTVADVSAVADPNTGVAVYDSYGSSGGANWFVYGGTSVAAPLVAGIWARTGPPTPSVSTAGAPYSHLSGWKDVTSGSNGSCSPTYLCNAGPGYDGPTGLGSPVGTTGFVGSGGSTTNNPPTASFTSSCTNLACTFTNSSTDSDGTVTGSSWAFGDGATSTSASPSHTYPAAGSYTVTLTVSDNWGTTGSVSHSVTVTGAATTIVLTAKGTKGLITSTVALSWTGAGGSVKVFRKATALTTTSSSSYTDSILLASGKYNYHVCTVASPVTCSNTVSVKF
jgi:subtilase family serine protease